ncbi:hypothetical protein SAMN05216325_1442 [Nitrosomonas marina]|uniref:HTH cro/C1-type domain-containing protein n=2 Tax=Nitrosomonas marina TaxID=917 RepID=A0A1H8IXB3_9PROT|nr:hypothetical protein SAMN05216325_1442 [Nitrosomonas marina]
MIYRMSDKEKALFSKRLKELCDEKNLPEYGRQTLLRKKFGVSQEAVRKWLDGESIPKHSHKVALCDYFGVNFEWLSTGRGIKYQELNKAEKTLKMLGIDPDKLDLDQVESIKILMEIPKENRKQAKRVIETFAKPDNDGEEQGSGG